MIHLEFEPDELDTLRAVVGEEPARVARDSGPVPMLTSMDRWTTEPDVTLGRAERLARVAAVLLGAKRE